MRTEGTFSVTDTIPTTLEPAPNQHEVGAPVGVLTFTKEYAGNVAGRSTTIFVAAYDQSTGVGTYVAMETFDGSLGDANGGFAFAHSATTHGADRQDELCVIVPGSGVGDLAGIHGGGGMAIDEDGTHRIWFDYDLA